MAFARWDPIRDLLAIQQRLDRFAPGPAGWTPPVDLLETSDAYIVIAELPGVAREDLTISVHDDGRLTLAGVRRERAGDQQAGTKARKQNQDGCESSRHDGALCGDVDASSCRVKCLRAGDSQDAVAKIGGDAVAVHGYW